MKGLIYSLLMSIVFVGFQSCNNDEPESDTITIGDFHQGGIVFYLDNTGEHGLICALVDQSFDAQWGCPPLSIDGANGTGIGAGHQNTLDIVSGCSSTTSGFAAELCYDFEVNGFDDWFLPSKDELDSLYQNIEIVDASLLVNEGVELEDVEYWTSSHLNSNTIYVQHFSAGNQFGVSEDELYNVRAIRAF